MQTGPPSAPVALTVFASVPFAGTRYACGPHQCHRRSAHAARAALHHAESGLRKPQRGTKRPGVGRSSGRL